MAQCDMGGGVVVRGLVATADAPQGTSVLSVPMHLALRDGALPPPYDGAPWNVVRACIWCNAHVESAGVFDVRSPDVAACWTS